MAPKTYILPPNLTTHPGGSLAIGTIIADPFTPLKPLSLAPKPLATVTHTELDAKLSHGSNIGFSTSVWAQFLQVASARVSGGVKFDVLSNYNVKSLETLTVRDHPTDEYAATRANEPKVKAAINAGMLGRDPVYMITGLKIAKGFEWEQSQGRSIHGEVGGSVPITEQVSAGAEVGGNRDTRYSYSSRTENDIIFAYQLHVIAEKGWRKKKITVDQFVPEGGLLGHDEGAQVEAAVDALPATKEEIAEAVEGHVLMSTEAKEGEDICVCLYLDS